MSFTRTITEGDMDSRSEEFVHEVRNDAPSYDADFEVDGMEESVGAKILGLFGE